MTGHSFPSFRIVDAVVTACLFVDSDEVIYVITNKGLEKIFKYFVLFACGLLNTVLPYHRVHNMYLLTE